MAKTAKKTSKKTTAQADTGQLSLLDPGESTVARAPRIDPDRTARAQAAPTQDDTPQPAPPKPRKAKRKSGYATAESMAKSQRSISVSEFFAKNRHLLGFDNPRKALLTTVKEAVDNALDACEEAGIMPIVSIEIDQIDDTHFRVTVEDNGPGIVKKQIPSIFGQLLYGSKFHRLRMSRGQQGIGISAAGMYGLLTTGQPVRIISRTSARSDAHFYELQIDTKQNRPDIIRDDVVEWNVPHGTRVSIELEAKYQKGKQSVDDYLQQTAIANPHVTVHYRAPDGRTDHYEASVAHLPATPKAIRPHPHGIELGVLLKMAGDAKGKTVQQFLCNEFSRVSARVAEEILTKAQVKPRTRSTSLSGDDVKAIYEAIQATSIMSPATDCVVPIGEEQLVSGIDQVVGAEFYAVKTRRPAVYRGNPFVIEVALAYGKSDAPTAPVLLEDPDAEPDDDEPIDMPQAKVIRFANRVPLQYQPGACAITKAITQLNWKSYGLSQSRGSLPSGPLTIVVHIASVWVPFTSESKEAIASYPEIIKELKLGLQEVGRKLGMHVRKAARAKQELKKRSYIEKYIPAIGEALRDILDLKDKQVAATCDNLKDILERSRKL
jgi:DNA topoisomerase VI subunit B